MTDYTIPRDQIAKVFARPRDQAAFEKLVSRFAEVDAQTVLAVEATQALADASFVTLSPNAELPNERVLQLGEGLVADVDAGTITLGLSEEAARVSGGFLATFVVEGEAMVVLPLTGRLTTREWVSAQLLNTRTVTASGAVLGDDALILVDASAGAVTLTLPAAAAAANRRLVVKKIDASGNAVTLDPNGAETIDGAASQAITGQYDALAIACDGTAWWIV